ncbi:MAG TPA: hypothetical protein PLL56_00055 [Verrucomicrobiota bacterium]|nr:hypothetical protein [Verrucomicrobiota bacterium]
MNLNHSVFPKLLAKRPVQITNSTFNVKWFLRQAGPSVCEQPGLLGALDNFSARSFKEKPPLEKTVLGSTSRTLEFHLTPSVNAANEPNLRPVPPNRTSGPVPCAPVNVSSPLFPPKAV